MIEMALGEILWKLASWIAIAIILSFLAVKFCGRKK